jgi:hypothetical protein
LLLVLVLEGIEAERSSIFQECSEGIDSRGSPCGIAWRLNDVHSWKEGCNHSHIAFSVALFFACVPSSAKCFKTFMLSCRRPKPWGLEWCSLGWAVQKHIRSPMTSK